MKSKKMKKNDEAEHNYDEEEEERQDVWRDTLTTSVQWRHHAEFGLNIRGAVL